MSIRKSYENEEGYLLALTEDHFHSMQSIAIKPYELQMLLVAFLNSEGGELYVGVENKKGMGKLILGFESINYATDTIRAILDGIKPRISDLKIEIIKFSKKGYVIHCTISKSPMIHFTSDSNCYVRINTATSEIKGEELVQLLLYKLSYSNENRLEFIKRYIDIHPDKLENVNEMSRHADFF